MSNKSSIFRRDFIKYTGLGFAGLALPGKGMATSSNSENKEPVNGSKTFETIYEKVCNTVLIDTHEHLFTETHRLKAKEMIGFKAYDWTYNANDWTFLFSHYFINDMQSAGMGTEELESLFKSNMGMMKKWGLLEPYWPYLKNTGYGMNVQITLKELYGIDDLNRDVIPLLQQKYKELIKPGFYKKIIREISGIESCQVNTWPLFLETDDPSLLQSDLFLDNLIGIWDRKLQEEPSIEVNEIEDWHRVIDYWFDKYGKEAVAVKVAMAYGRNIDFEPTNADAVRAYFKELIAGKRLNPEQEKMLQDHLFWYCIDKATKLGLPVKLHTGYYAGNNYLELKKISGNPDAVAHLCIKSSNTKFVIFHIGYPFQEEMLTVAKNITNAHIDMCWAWIINPIAAKDFLKKFIVTVPLNKITVFGGDYMPVELLPGHARIARIGIAQALSELVEESWIGIDDALWMTDVLMHENARQLYDLKAL